MEEQTLLFRIIKVVLFSLNKNISNKFSYLFNKNVLWSKIHVGPLNMCDPCLDLICLFLKLVASK